LQKVEGRYFQLKKGNVKSLKNEYLNSLYWKDEIHVFQAKGEYFNGKIIGVESSGKLMVELEEGERSYDFKEIVFVK
jgi:BirA family biotin operon repressor/biotin-[acetyl-CoA-carboxylase] ligase